MLMFSVWCFSCCVVFFDICCLSPSACSFVGFFLHVFFLMGLLYIIPSSKKDYSLWWFTIVYCFPLSRLAFSLVVFVAGRALWGYNILNLFPLLFVIIPRLLWRMSLSSCFSDLDLIAVASCFILISSSFSNIMPSLLDFFFTLQSFGGKAGAFFQFVMFGYWSVFLQVLWFDVSL